MEIKFSNDLAYSEAKRITLKCSWSDCYGLLPEKNVFKRFIYAAKVVSPYSTKYKPLYDFCYRKFSFSKYESLKGDVGESIGIATGNYIDYASRRYIEITVIPTERMMAEAISREWLQSVISGMYAPNSEYKEYKKEIEDIYYGKGYDKEKYILCYGIPETVWIPLDSVQLFADDNVETDKGTLTPDDVVEILPTENAKKGSVKTLLLGTAILLTINSL